MDCVISQGENKFFCKIWLNYSLQNINLEKTLCWTWGMQCVSFKSVWSLYEAHYTRV